MKKTHVIISLDAEQAFDKSLHDKSPQDIKDARNIHQHNKGSSNKPIANIELNGEKLKPIPLK